jgi:hypothetical protein
MKQPLAFNIEYILNHTLSLLVFQHSLLLYSSLPLRYDSPQTGRTKHIVSHVSNGFSKPLWSLSATQHTESTMQQIDRQDTLVQDGKATQPLCFQIQGLLFVDVKIMFYISSNLLGPPVFCIFFVLLGHKY